MKIYSVSSYKPSQFVYGSKFDKKVQQPVMCGYNDIVPFEGKPKLSKQQMEQISDLKVFNHHIYEFKKEIRTLILTTEKSKHKEVIEDRLKHEKIDYVIHDVDDKKINVFFGEKPCVDVVKTLNPKLSEHTPQEDFMLGILLGYDKVKQCVRYLDFRQRAKQKWTQ